MSYLNLPRLHFSGKFRANPSTLNNTPDNFNPNNRFPPDNGGNVGNNIQLYWNPNGTAEFELDCTVTKICYADGRIATTNEEDPLVGQPFQSLCNTRLESAKVVDLDPMQQNVTEIWGLRVGIGPPDGRLLTGAFKPSAYSNAWVQVVDGRGDYAGSAFYQSILHGVECNLQSSPFSNLAKESDGSHLSIGFVLRSFNSSSLQYLVNKNTLEIMTLKGIPGDVTAQVAILSRYNQSYAGNENSVEGRIPTTSYFEKLLKSTLEPIPEAYVKYRDEIMSCTQQPYTPLTDYPFTYGQVFGTIGLSAPGEPEFLAPDRMLTPPSVVETPGSVRVPTDSGGYNAYFAPFKVGNYTDENGEAKTYVAVNLGNSLPSTQPASDVSSFVDFGALGNLRLCCFYDGVKLIGEIRYIDNSLYLQDSGIVDVPISKDDEEIVKNNPLGIVRVDSHQVVEAILLRENSAGYYLRANQFVYRMNPGLETLEKMPYGESANVDIYATQFGRPASGQEIEVSLLSSLEAATYSNNTLGTGGTTGMVNMSVPESAVQLEGRGSSPVSITTGENGKATLQVKALDPGNPRGYMDGQIYFLRYGFKDAAIRDSYVQSPDDLISVQVYQEQPDIENVTWGNFVQSILAQYAKIYPVMGFLNLSDPENVKKHAKEIKCALLRSVQEGCHMPVTRDLSESRTKLIVAWLDQFIPPSQSE